MHIRAPFTLSSERSWHNATYKANARAIIPSMHAPMTGDRFRSIRDELDLSLRDLAKRWGVDPRTINREEKKQRVRGLYRDAIKRVQRLHTGAEGDEDDEDDDNRRRPTSSAPPPRSR